MTTSIKANLTVERGREPLAGYAGEGLREHANMRT